MRPQISETSPPNVTELLLTWRDGDASALERLVPIVLSELRSIAHNYVRREAPEHQFQTTELIHEAYLRLVGLDSNWRGRNHFFAVASQIMRRILVDMARRRNSAKRGGGRDRVPLDEVEISSHRAMKVIELDDALRRLESIDARKSQVLELRFFGGMTIAETADALGVAHSTVERDFNFAKAWLHDCLS